MNTCGPHCVGTLACGRCGWKVVVQVAPPSVPSDGCALNSENFSLSGFLLSVSAVE